MTNFFWPHEANQVALVGSFNEWHPSPMTRGPKGFHLSLDLAPGVYEYKFLVDGRRWCYDILKPTSTDDRGNRNNTITVKGGTHAQQPAKHVAKVESNKPQEADEVQQVDEKLHQQEDVNLAQEDENLPQQPQKGGKGKGGQQQQGKGQQQQGKGKGGQQQQQGKGKGGGQQKGGGVSKVARNQADTLIKTVKSFKVPFYVGDVDCESVEDVLAIANLFANGLPDIGCMIIYGGVEKFVVAAVVPADKTSTITATEWVDEALSVVPGHVSTGNATLAHGIIPADPEKGIFAIKLKDLCRAPTFVLLRKRGLVKEESSEDEMYFLDE